MNQFRGYQKPFTDNPVYRAQTWAKDKAGSIRNPGRRVKALEAAFYQLNGVESTSVERRNFASNCFKSDAIPIVVGS